MTDELTDTLREIVGRLEDRGIPYMLAKYSRYSSIVRFRGLPNSAGMNPSVRRNDRGSAHTDFPCTRISPLSGFASDEISRSSVVFPAPFGPIRPSVSPGSTRRVTPSTATTSS